MKQLVLLALLLTFTLCYAFIPSVQTETKHALTLLSKPLSHFGVVREDNGKIIVDLHDEELGQFQKRLIVL